MKILIIHASAGAGHKKAAEALYNHLKDASRHDVAFADVLDYTNSFYRRTYRGSYTFLVTKLPLVWALFFGLTDFLPLRPIVKLIRRFVNHFNAKSLVRFLKEEQFDVILSTHFFPNEVAACLKRKGAILSKIISVVTDFDVHSLWLAEGIDYYTAACEYTREKLIRLGVAQDKVVVTGIPTDKKFSIEPDRQRLQDKLQIKKDIFTVLVATGSFGMGPIKEIIVQLEGYQILVVCGNNKGLFEELSQQRKELVKIYGLVNNMDELMAVADIMITKPGGLSISEALVRGLPLIFFSAIPGQEINNVRVLKHDGIGTSGFKISAIVQEVKKLSGSKDYFALVKQNTQRLARPNAASDICKLIS